MAFTYQIPQLPSRTNALLVVVFPYRYKTLRGDSQATIAKAMETEEPIFLEEYALTVQARSSKHQHVSNINIVLKDPHNLSSKIAPNDWMMVWMFSSIEDRDRVKAAIKKERVACHFNDGIKFLGKISSLGKDIVINQGTGGLQNNLVITGQGFSEFDSSVYFDPALDMGRQDPNLFWAMLTTGIQQLNGMKDITVTTAINLLLSIFMGSGPNSASKTPSLLNKPTQAAVTAKTAKDLADAIKKQWKQISFLPKDPNQIEEVNNADTLSRSPNTIFAVPVIVGRLLGNTNIQPGATHLTYSSLLMAIFGCQDYSQNNEREFQREVIVDRLKSPNAEAWVGFIPTISVWYKRRLFCTKFCSGNFGPQVQAWAGAPIWAILGQFLNPAMNEMYTSLRVSVDGLIQPTLTVRTIPFTTERDTKSHNVTHFLSLPRWKIPLSELMRINVVQSNSMLINFVHTTNISPLDQGNPITLSLQRSNSRPAQDTWDIVRNGVRPYLQSTTNFPSDTTTNISANPVWWWNNVIADRMMGMNLRWTGQIQVKGIQEPICEGDNLQIEDMVYHIEQVTHTMSINQQSGSTTWETTLAVSNGVPADGKEVFAIDKPYSVDEIVSMDTTIVNPDTATKEKESQQKGDFPTKGSGIA